MLGNFFEAESLLDNFLKLKFVRYLLEAKTVLGIFLEIESLQDQLFEVKIHSVICWKLKLCVFF